MDTPKKLLEYAQSLIDKLGEDAPIIYNVLDKTDIQTVLDDDDIDLMNDLTPDLLDEIFFILDKYGCTNYDEIADVLGEFSMGSDSIYHDELIERRRKLRGVN